MDILYAVSVYQHYIKWSASRRMVSIHTY